MEVCGDIPVANPLLQIQKNVSVTYLESSDITSANLLTTFDETDAKFLVYTITSKPALGKVLLNNNVLSVGNTFTQEDINLGKIKYVNVGPESLLPNENVIDSMGVIVQNGLGGFDGVKYLKFEIQNMTTSTPSFDNEGL